MKRFNFLELWTLELRLYLSTFINSIGTWLTFLAIALIVNERFGPEHVALVFLVQTVPAILFSRTLASLIPAQLQERYYWVSQVLLAISSLLLVFSQNLFLIYMTLFVSAFLKSISSPLFNTLIGKHISPQDHQRVFTKVSALQAGTLALAPVLGAWIKIAYSAKMLFALDALSFIVSILLLKEFFNLQRSTEEGKTNFKLSWGQLFAGISLKPKDVPKTVLPHLQIWFLFLIIGALLNAIEFAGFSNAQMSEKHIGYAMAAWGLGSLIAFLRSVRIHVAYLSAGFAIALTLFVLAKQPMFSIIAFSLAGALSSYITGALRGTLQASVPKGFNAMPTWAYANQVTQLINLICYGTAGFFLQLVGFSFFGYAMVLFTIILAFILFSKKTNQLTDPCHL